MLAVWLAHRLRLSPDMVKAYRWSEEHEPRPGPDTVQGSALPDDPDWSEEEARRSEPRFGFR